MEKGCATNDKAADFVPKAILPLVPIPMRRRWFKDHRQARPQKAASFQKRVSDLTCSYTKAVQATRKEARSLKAKEGTESACPRPCWTTPRKVHVGCGSGRLRVGRLRTGWLWVVFSFFLLFLPFTPTRSFAGVLSRWCDGLRGSPGTYCHAFLSVRVLASRMGNANSAPRASAASEPTWDVRVNKALREGFGITATGGVYLTGLDAVTLPTAYLAGYILGSGIGIWRGQANFWRPARGMGTLLVGMTLALPPYVRMIYAPWLILSPGAVAWAGLTTGIIGVGAHLLAKPRAEDEHALALVVDPTSWGLGVPATISNKFCGATLIGVGLYLAAPGALRLAMMFGSS